MVQAIDNTRAARSDGVAVASADEERGRVFPCEQCGAELRFHIGAQRLKCNHCGFEKALQIDDTKEIEEQDLSRTLERLAAQHRKTEAPTATASTGELHCQACGATVVFSGTLTSTACAYCGAPTQRSEVHENKDRIAVDAVLTFGVDEAAARRGVAAWVKSRWFAPNEFKKRGVQGKLEGTYLPYYSYDAMTTTSYRGARGDHYYVTVGHGQQQRRERRTRWTAAAGWFQRFFDDVLVPALRSLPFALLCKLEPWPLGKCVPFTPDALAGKLAHTYDVELGEGFTMARQRIEEALRADVRRRIGGDEQRIDVMRTAYAALTYKHLLLPLWLLAYRFHDKSYRVFVNACTGKVEGERPYSWIKIGLAVFAALLVVTGVVLYSQYAQN